MPGFALVTRRGIAVSEGITARVDVALALAAAEEVVIIDYYYASRLPGEPAAGVNDIHTHPAEPRTARVAVLCSC